MSYTKDPRYHTQTHRTEMNDFTVRMAPKDRPALYRDVPIQAHNVTEARELAEGMYSNMRILRVW